MIVIKKPKIEKHGDKVRLVAEVSVCNNKKGGLWIEVDSRYGECLCSERSDAFVAGLMFLAIKNREDIYFEAPITDELKDGIEHQFIDVLYDILLEKFKNKSFRFMYDYGNFFYGIDGIKKYHIFLFDRSYITCKNN